MGGRARKAVLVLARHPAPDPPMRPIRQRRVSMLADFIGLIAKRTKLILQVTAATVIAAVLFAFSLPTVWTSSAVVMLEPRLRTPWRTARHAAPAQIDPATLQNQIQILESRQLAERVIDSLELESDPEFNGTLMAPGLARHVRSAQLGQQCAFRRAAPARDGSSKPSSAASAAEAERSFHLHHRSAPAPRDPKKRRASPTRWSGAYVEGQLSSEAEHHHPDHAMAGFPRRQPGARGPVAK